MCHKLAVEFSDNFRLSSVPYDLGSTWRITELAMSIFSMSVMISACEQRIYAGFHGFRKDLANALNASHAIHMPVPMTAHMMEVMPELQDHGEGSCDHSGIVRFYERITGTSLLSG